MASYYDGYDWDVDGFPGEYVYGDRFNVDDFYNDSRWLPIQGYPGYWVSNKGEVYGPGRYGCGHFLTPTPGSKGHLYVTLKNEYGSRKMYVHRLVAEAFIPNPNNLPTVRHLDDIPDHNEDIDNLAWGTQLDNMRDCIANKHFRYFTREDIERANNIRRTPIVAIRLRDGRKIAFASQQEASRQLGIDQSCINAVIMGKNRSTCGYYFAKQEAFDDSFDYHRYSYQRRGVPIEAIHLSTGETRVYDKPRYAAYDLGMSEASVSNVLRGKARSAKGWTFRELDMEDDTDEFFS